MVCIPVNHPPPSCPHLDQYFIAIWNEFVNMNQMVDNNVPKECCIGYKYHGIMMMKEVQRMKEGCYLYLEGDERHETFYQKWALLQSLLGNFSH